MVDSAEQRQILSEILESPDFRDSRRYQDLLRFLVEETLAGNSPKEITIAAQIFGKDASFDPREDPTVRVYINNLRKKLEHYYLTLNPSPAIRLEIPKGHYQVEFARIPAKGPAATATQPERKHLLWMGAGAMMMGAVLVSLYLLGFGPRSTQPLPLAIDSPIWMEFVQGGGRPTLVVLGDYFFLYERPDSGKRGNFIRNPLVNTPDDYKAEVKRDPAFGQRYLQSDFTFVRPSAVWGVTEILPILQHSPNGYSLKLSSQVTFDDLKSNNLVFIGTFKTLYAFQKILHLFGLEYSPSPASVRVVGNQGDSVRVFRPGEIRGGSYEKDFSIVAKAPGPNGSMLLLLLGFADAGVIDAARTVMGEGIRSRIEREYASAVRDGLGQFTLILEAEGINQSVFKSEIRHFVQRQGTHLVAEPTPSDSARLH